MLSGINKKEASILAGLVGIIIGMTLSIFLEYPITYINISRIISSSCRNDTIDRINLSVFGKIITVRCTNGETSTFKLIE